ncbi:hypothetical protein CG717_26280 [Streptomyces sp. CB02613]|uniref:hypothetical protein n=1 Tax=Streptomyces sp. CB02613 TaxID=2020328 RepID=UPI000C26DB97|nr:hypothetical protein [Streptomyces sp. CB02613]PJN27659.1 hypothetical protein CG717_26280 [Streptomyces sp. CB02613]
MDDREHQELDRYAPETASNRLLRVVVRIVVLVVVLPVRMVWDLAVAGGQVCRRVLLPPAGRALTALAGGVGWVLERLFGGIGWVLGWLIGTLVLRPLRWLYTSVLTPLGHGLRWIGTALLLPALYGLGNGIGWLITVLLIVPLRFLWRYVAVPVVRFGLVVPAVWLYANVLTPIGLGTAWVLSRLWQGTAWTLGTLWQGTAWVLAQLWRGIAATGRGLGLVVAWLVMTLLVAPIGWAYRRILTPVGREIAAAFEVTWRIAGYVSRAVGRALAWLAWHLIGAPVSWAYRTVCTPVGHFLRDAVWAPARRAAAEAGRAARAALTTARETVRQARRDAWRALVGAAAAERPGEPRGIPARTLGSTTTVPSAAQASESPLGGDPFAKQG